MILPSWAEIIKRAISKSLDGLHTSIPAKVSSFSIAGGHRTVELVTASKDLPVLQDVPVSFARSGGCFLNMPINIGDTGVVVFSEIDFSLWRQAGNQETPNMLIRHGLHGVFLPGLDLDSKPLNNLLMTEFGIGKEFGPLMQSGPSALVFKNAPQDVTGPLAASSLVKYDQFSIWVQAVESTLQGLGVPITPLSTMFAETTSLKAE